MALARQQVDLAIVGGGPAGLAAALAAQEAGVESICIYERDERLGGILNQCIHNGFGLHRFGEELTGPEYAERYIDALIDAGIDYQVGTTVLNITPGLEIMASSAQGVQVVQAGAIVLAMGCRERPRGALSIPGYRPAGIYTAGTAQRLVNMEGFMPGRKVLILGSGDIGLIMARRLTLEGAQVAGVAELMPYSGGLKRNIVQCLEDFDIPLWLSCTVVGILGKERVEAVTLAQVGSTGTPIAGTERTLECDTLLLSCGLLPENELSRQAGVTLNRTTGGPIVTQSLETSVPGIFAAGNVLHVHDLVDYVSEEAAQAGRAAAAYLACRSREPKSLLFSAAEKPIRQPVAQHGQEAAATPSGYAPIALEAGAGVRYSVPSTIDVGCLEGPAQIRFRVTNVFKGASLVVLGHTRQGEQVEVLRRKKPAMVPAEMETLVIPAAKLLTEAGEPLAGLTVLVEEAS